MSQVTASVTAVDTGTAFLPLRGQNNKPVVSVSGSFVATVEVQLKRAEEAAGDAVAATSYTAPAIERANVPGAWDIRLQVTAFTSGTVELAIYDDDN